MTVIEPLKRDRSLGFQGAVFLSGGAAGACLEVVQGYPCWFAPHPVQTAILVTVLPVNQLKKRCPLHLVAIHT